MVQHSKLARTLAAAAIMTSGAILIGGQAPAAAAPRPAAATCDPFVRDTRLPIDLCSSGPLVREVQALINPWLPARITVDGLFGPATEAAVRAFQARSGLTVDGIVGRNTYTRAVGLAGRCPSYHQVQHFPLMNCDEGLIVAYAQVLLNWAMPDRPFPVGGHYGPNTYRAVKEFQRRLGVEVDGILTQRTYSALVYIAVATGHLD